MSILAWLSMGAARQMEISPEVVLVLLTAASIGVAVATRVFPPRKINSRERIPADRSAVPLLAVLFGAMGVYLFVAASVDSVFHHRHSGTAQTVAPATMSPPEVAVQSTVIPLFAFVAFLLGDRLVLPLVRQDLGLGSRRIGGGVARGVLGAFIVVPPLYLLSQVMEIAYRGLRYNHPTEHPLLKVLGEKPGGAVMIAIIIGACVLAPLFEELLFRGHIQTLLKRLLRGNWAAIVLTSVLFSLVHPMWSWPIIFVLAVCLGYAYERTGNLWVNITMHAAFNTVSTVLFLAGEYSH